jgi:hypothetical protein
MEHSKELLPALICTDCLSDLSNAIKFRNRCLISDKWFKEFIKSTLDQERNEHEFIVKNEPIDINELLENIDIAMPSHKKEETENEDQSGFKLKKKKRHKIENVDDNAVQCSLCLKSFTSAHSLKDHMRAIHQKLDTADMFKCKFCDRLFKMKYYLSQYINHSI